MLDAILIETVSKWELYSTHEHCRREVFMKHFHFDWDCFKVGTIFGTANCSFENVLCSFFFKNGL